MAGLFADLLSGGIPIRVRASGGSMFPFVRDGDVLTLVSTPASGPGLGDVVAFRCAHAGPLVVHRVVAKAGKGCVLKGDSYLPGQTDGLISKENLLGVVSRLERQGRPVRFGFGPERRLIALLSRWGWLLWLVRLAAAGYRLWKRL
jgi:hypothetical protein